MTRRAAPGGPAKLFHAAFVFGSACACKLACLFAALVSVGSVHGIAPPRAPILSVEVGMHTAMIRRVAVSEARGVVVTASDDKTVRVWSLADLRLLRTLRPPIGPGHEGRPFALALSPDGATIAVGGWTGWSWDGRASIYLFDAQTGVLVRRLAGLPNIVGYLAYSRDGRHLAAGLGGAGGTRIYRTSDYALEFEDRAYSAAVLGIDFDPRGRVAVSSLDGRVRLYDERFRRLTASGLPGSLTPVVVQFSPDGESLAVASYAPRVLLLSGRDLSPLDGPRGDGLEGQIDLPGVAWSVDGRELFAIGDHRNGGSSPVFRWRIGSPDRPERIATSATLRLTGFVPLSTGGAVYVSEDPVIGVLEPDGRSTRRKTPGIADFRDIGQALRVSRDGMTVEFAFDKGGGPLVHMALLERKELQPGPVPGEWMSSAMTGAPGLHVSDWKDRKTPRANGSLLALGRGEYSRSLAIAPDRQRFVLGAEWSLRAYDAGGRPLWVTPTAQVAWGVAISGDGRVLVAALSDGTLRWYRMDDGREYLALFPHRDGDWIVWVPQGYYFSSENGDRYVGWQLNRGTDSASDHYLAVQFERVLYRYDIVSAQLASRGTDGGPGDGQRFDIRQLATIAPPRIRFESLQVAGPESGPRLELAFSSTTDGLPMREYAVFVNGIPVTPARERDLAHGERQGFARQVAVDIWTRELTVRVEVSNGTSVGIAETRLEAPAASRVAAPRGDLYLLAVGISRFPLLPAEWQLRYPADDADAIAAVFGAQKGRRYDRVFVQVLSDRTRALPTRDAIVAALEFLQRAGPRDTVLVFLASHALVSPSGSYYFVPRDARRVELERAMRGQEPGAKAALIGWETFFDAMRRTAGRRLMIVDTCAGRGIEGTIDSLWLKKRSAAASFALMVSSRASEKSQEFDRGRHGLFTYALLRGLDTACGGACPTDITLERLFAFVGPWVSANRQDKRLAQTPQLNAPPELRRLVLARQSTSRVDPGRSQ